MSLKTNFLSRAALALFCILGFSHGYAAPLETPGADPGSTVVLKWKDGKKAVFLLQFDDSASSAVKTVIPELKKRGMAGTFYINPGNAPFKNLQKQWETEMPGPGIVYANHTFTHVGATSVDQLDGELAKCNEAIAKCYPDLKLPRLISFGQPGGVPWTVSKDETKAALAKHNLIERPPFKGFPFQFKKVEDMLALIDKALEKGDMEYLVFHGVGADWLITPLEMFTAILDKLDANKDKIWVADVISYQQYLAERKSADVKVAEAAAAQIRVTLTTAENAELYNLPLTLATRVPADWKECQVTQGTLSTAIPAVEGIVMYSAIPGTDEIVIKPKP